MTTTKIKWVFTGTPGDRDTAGNWSSACGRWTISPLYMGCTTAQAFDLNCNAPKKGHGFYNTVREAKAQAQDISEREATPAAACQRCGGWTSFGGCSQHHATQVPVMGRMGCTCASE